MSDTDNEQQPASYSAATDELESILNDIETGNADIDELSQRVERAAHLIKLCQEKIAGAEMRVQKIFEELAADRSGDSAEES